MFSQNLGGYHTRNLLNHIANIKVNNPKVLDTSTTEGMIQDLEDVIAPYIKDGKIQI